MGSQPSTINPRLLQQHFDTLADTPEAVAKLRNFVLSLAVRGQLLRQNAEDEKPARWKEFVTEFSQPNAQAQEPPFQTPESWRWVRLTDVADYHAADKVDPSEIKDGDWVLDLEEIEKDTSRITRVATFAEKQSSSTKAKFLPGDVLYGKLRPYLNKVVVAPQGGFCTTEIVPIRSRGLIEPDYLCVYLRSADFVGYANSKSYGMKMPRLGTDDAKSAWVAVPPPAEQRRIVAKVEELLALCDALEAAQTAVREHRTRLVRSALDHLTTAQDEFDFKKHSAFCLQHSELLFDSVPALRQGIISLAVQGRLLPQDSKDEPAEKSLRRGFELPKDYNRRPKRAKETAIELPEDVFPQLPKSWTYATVQQLYDLNAILGFEDGNHGSLYPRKTDFGNEGIRFVTAAQFDAGRIDWPRVPKLASDKAAGLAKGWAQGGDVLLTHNASVGDVAFAEEDAGTFLLGTSVTFYRLHRGALESRFIYYVFQSLVWQNQLAAVMQQTTRNQVSIQKQAFFRVPVPPLAEQQRIVAKVDELLRWCDALEARLTAARTTATHLLDATLHQILAA